MSQAEYRAELRSAIDTAKQHPRNAMPEIATTLSIELRQSGSRYVAAHCPFCDRKGKFTINQRGGEWVFGCFRNSCEGKRPGDVISLLERVGSMSRRDAVRHLLDRAGIEHPYDRFMREREEGRK